MESMTNHWRVVWVGIFTLTSLNDTLELGDACFYYTELKGTWSTPQGIQSTRWGTAWITGHYHTQSHTVQKIPEAQGEHTHYVHTGRRWELNPVCKI